MSSIKSVQIKLPSPWTFNCQMVLKAKIWLTSMNSALNLRMSRYCHLRLHPCHQQRQSHHRYQICSIIQLTHSCILWSVGPSYNMSLRGGSLVRSRMLGQACTESRRQEQGHHHMLPLPIQQSLKEDTMIRNLRTSLEHQCIQNIQPITAMKFQGHREPSFWGLPFSTEKRLSHSSHSAIRITLVARSPSTTLLSHSIRFTLPMPILSLASQDKVKGLSTRAIPSAGITPLMAD